MKDHRPVLGDEDGGNYIKVTTGSHEVSYVLIGGCL